MSIDHTKIDIKFDPTIQRMVGVTYHQEIPFDVPFISEILPNLYLGGCEDGLILPNHIENVISLYPWESYEYHDRVRSVLSIEMYDDNSGVSPKLIDSVANWALSAWSTSPTLIHCQAGLNRSSLIMASVLLKSGVINDIDDAISLIREKRSDACLCNKSFVRTLYDMYA